MTTPTRELHGNAMEGYDPTPTPRDCEHGQLARSCEICELKRELAAAQERIEALEDALNMATQGKYSELMLRLADQVADQRTSRRIVK